ncbi:MAG: hypothetical protein EPN98_21665 [Phenylobacterium sp.]|uniref:hypothetical protein n=1 Tax=Phenylobacterium sp. TaxID=1871053 RepID=UPI001221D986|nr:hypothetical protein [Phenylobacterium sp.]TAL29053.1 MAG: hypothetical protein EPN98_21665 [Phenylobacterium sp.]
MGMSTHIAGIVPPDETWQKKKAAYDACREAGIPIPKELDAFFGGEPPDPSGVVISLDRTAVVKEWSSESASGFEVDLAGLPKHIKILRFYNAW